MKPKILIADDDPGVQDIFRIIFEKAGYDTTIDPDGSSILKNTYTTPDIFLLDKQLSGLDGLDICRHLKKSPATRNIPVIIVSASPDIARLAAEAGADASIEKPFTIQHLLSEVKKAITHRLHDNQIRVAH